MNAESYLKTLRVLYFTFLSSQILFVIAGLTVQEDTYFSLEDEGNVYLIMVPVFALVGFFAGRATFQKQLEAIADKKTLKEKVNAYSSAFLVRVALLEAPTLFATVAFFLTGNLALLGVALLMILFFLTLSPGKEKVARDLGLTFQEKAVWDENRAFE